MEIKVALVGDGPFTAFVDRIRMEQVLLNLVWNAMDAMPTGGLLTLRAISDNAGMRIEVEDTGGGIPQEFQDKIFDPYFTTRGKGTGLGLALSEKIVRQHGGTIDFRTGPAGTVFVVVLPREEEA